jgi:hypothetical protein
MSKKSGPQKLQDAKTARKRMRAVKASESRKKPEQQPAEALPPPKGSDEQQQQVAPLNAAKDWHPIIQVVLPLVIGFGSFAASTFYQSHFALSVLSFFVSFVLFLFVAYVLLRHYVWKDAHHRKRLKYSCYAVGAIALLACVVAFGTRETQQAKPPLPMVSSPIPSSSPAPFSISMDGGMSSEERTMGARLWYVYDSKYGRTASPVHKAMVIKLTNNQPTPSVIETYEVEVLNNQNKWVKLTRVNMRSGDIYWVYDNFHEARWLNFRQNSLDNILSMKTLRPRETVRGWAFFEIPEDLGMENPMRIYVKDMGGAEMTQEIKFPLQDDGGLQDNVMPLEGMLDISSYIKRYYSETSLR